MSESEDFNELFFIELKERSDEANEILQQLDLNRGDTTQVEAMLRILHTIKGMASSMNYDNIASVCHKLESTLIKEIANGLISDNLYELLVKFFDHMNNLIAGYKHGKNVVDADFNDLLNSIANMESISINIGQKYKIKVEFTIDCALKGARALLILNHLEKVADIISTNPTKDEIQSGRMISMLEIDIMSFESEEKIREQVNVTDVKSIEISAVTDIVGSSGSTTGTKQINQREFLTIRVNLDHLDYILNGLGELIITKSRLEQYSSKVKDRNFSNLIAEIEHTIFDLQKTVIHMRTVPMEYLFSRLPRLVNDVEKLEKKKVRLLLVGKHIDADRAILDALSQPLIHLVKNAVSHGIEIPEKRKELEKPEEGLVKVEAYLDRDEIVLEVSDDGKGIDIEKIHEIAIKKGLISEEMRISRVSLISLVFNSNFSTKDEVTTVSGRGMGLGIVKKSIEAVGGTVELHTKKNKGTTITLRLPMSVSITQALIVKVDHQKYAIPMSNVDFITLIDPERILRTGKRMHIVVNKEVIPVIDLETVLQHASEVLPVVKESAQISKNDVIILWKRARKQTALLVKELIGQTKIVTKKFDDVLNQNLKGFSGATILGEGDVVLILDPSQMMEVVS